MKTLMQNWQTLVVQHVMKVARAALETELDAIVNLAYKQGYNDAITGKERQA